MTIQFNNRVNTQTPVVQTLPFLRCRLRRCERCGMPLFVAWLFWGFFWQKRKMRISDARVCEDLVPQWIGDMGIGLDSKA